MNFIKKTHLLNVYAITIIVVIALVAIACEKPKKTPPAPETGTVTDQQGRVYKTVKIGGQWWMAEDLAVTKYRDGTDIPRIEEKEVDAWKNDSTGAYTAKVVVIQSFTFNSILYNWNAVNNPANLAPAGWHVPSDEEWKILEQHLGMAKADADKVNWRGSSEGEKLKEKNTTQFIWWEHAEVWATNESGFSALPLGCRMFYGTFGQPDGGGSRTGFWWSSTPNGSNAWYRYLDYKNSNVFRFYGPKNYGFAVRCVLD